MRPSLGRSLNELFEFLVHVQTILRKELCEWREVIAMAYLTQRSVGKQAVQHSGASHSNLGSAEGPQSTHKSSSMP